MPMVFDYVPVACFSREPKVNHPATTVEKKRELFTKTHEQNQLSSMFELRLSFDNSENIFKLCFS